MPDAALTLSPPIYFTTPYEVTNGVEYAICLYGAGIPSGKALFTQEIFFNPYSGGQAINRAVQGVDPWVGVARDNLFEVWEAESGGTVFDAEVTVAGVGNIDANGVPLVNLQADHVPKSMLIAIGNDMLYYEDVL
jgi:hypothetical protein